MDKKEENKYRKRNGLISIKEEQKARRRLHKRRKKGYSVGLLVMTGGLGAIGRARGLGKDKRLHAQLDRLEADQERRERHGEKVFYPQF